MLLDKTYFYYKKVIKGTTHYYISFYDVNRTLQKVEVDRMTYLTFIRCQRMERNQKSWDKRNSAITDYDDNIFSSLNPPSAEQVYIDNEGKSKIREAMSDLSPKQRRRFVLYHKHGLTLEKIAKMEGCTKRAIKFSIDKAKEAIVNKLLTF